MTTAQFLIRNNQVVARISGQTTLKDVKASANSTEDALNAEFPVVLVNSQSCKVSSAKKWQGTYTEVFAKPLPGGRPDQFLIY